MQSAIITVVYHSSNGHTKQLALFIAEAIKYPQIKVQVLDIVEAKKNLDILHQSDSIVFGCPTYLGNVSAAFKTFMESTGNFWYKQTWKNKLATAFTISSTTNGDKLNTLTTLFLFAAQHSMHWINLVYYHALSTTNKPDGQNRLASYIGLMAQCNNGQEVHPLHSGDQLTAELFAQRITETTLQFKHIKITNYDTVTN